MLKEKKLLPEDLNTDNVEDSLNFSEEYLASFEEALSIAKQHVKDRDQTISNLSGNIRELKECLRQATDKENIKDVELAELRKKVGEIEKKELEKARKSKKRRFLGEFLKAIGKKCVFIIAVTILGYLLIRIFCKLLNKEIDTWIGIIVSAAPLLTAALLKMKKDWKQYQERKMEIDEEKF